MQAISPPLHAAHIGVGGGASKLVLDNNIADVPFSIHFEPGHASAHVSAATLNKMTGNKVSTQINPTAISFGTTANHTEETQFVTAHLGNAEKSEPLHTLGREFHISSAPSASQGEATVSAAHAVLPVGSWPRSSPIKHVLQDLSGMHGNSHLSAGHTDSVSIEQAKMQAKQAVTWKHSLGASMQSVMHGCVTAEDGGKSRVSIPLDDSHEAGGKGQLAALCHRKQDSLRELMGDHYITEPMLNPTTQKMCKHVVVTANAATDAAAVLQKNLDPGPLGGGITFTCRTANGDPPDNHVMLQACFHRTPASVDGAEHRPGAPPVTVANIMHVIDNGETTGTASVSVNAEQATSNLTRAMFAKPVRLRDSATPGAAFNDAGNIASQKAPTTVEVHGAALEAIDSDSE